MQKTASKKDSRLEAGLQRERESGAQSSQGVQGREEGGGGGGISVE